MVTPVLYSLNEFLVEDDALANVFDPDVFICIMNGRKLRFIEIDRSKTQNMIGNIGKTSCVRTCRKQERNDCDIGKRFVKKLLNSPESLSVKIGWLAVVSFYLFDLHAILFSDFLYFFKTCIKIIFPDAS